MNRVYPKRICLFLFIVILAVISGCTTPTVNPPSITREPSPGAITPTPQPTPTFTPEVPLEYRVDVNTLKGSEILFLHPFTGALAGQYEEWSMRFNQENPFGMKVRVLSSGGMDSLPALTQSENPQVILAPPEYLSFGLNAGWITPLDGYLSLHEWGLSETEQQEIHEMFWLQDRFSGAQSGFPALRTVYGMVYNRTWANELGYPEAPITPQELLEQACAAARQNNRSVYLEKRGTGGWLLSTEPFHDLVWWYAFNARVLPEKPGEPIQFNQTEVNVTLKFLRNMQAQGCLWQGLNPSPYGYFSDRYTLFYIGSLQDLSFQQGYQQSTESKDEWLLIPFPQEDGKPFYLTTGYSYGLLKNDPHLQMAGWLWIRWLTENTRQMEITRVYGGISLENPFKDSLLLPELQKHFEGEASLIPLPGNPDWLVIRRPIQDAFWQVFHLAEGQSVEDVVAELKTLAEYELFRSQSTPTP